jgi:hypothetical protein
VALGYVPSDNPHVFGILAPSINPFQGGSTFWSNGHLYYGLAYVTVQGWNGETGHFNEVPFAFRLNLNWRTSTAQPLLSGDLVFTGTINGTAGPGQFQVTNTLTGSTSQTLMLGGHRFDVSVFQAGVGPYPPPGPPPPGHPNLFAQISVDGVDATPEPSTLVMAFLSVGTLAAVGGWKRLRSASVA